MFIFAPTPDWSKGFREALDFKTEVFKTTSGIEYREFRRENPAWFMEFDVIEDLRADGALSSLFAGARDSEFYVASPVHHLKYLSGPDEAPVYEDMGWVQPGQFFLVGDTPYEVSSVAAGQVSLAAIPAGEFTMFGGSPRARRTNAKYLVKGRFDSEATQNFLTDSKSRMSMAFKASPDHGYPYRADLPNKFSGNSFFDMPHNWRSAQDVEYTANRRWVTAPSGAEEVFYKDPLGGLSLRLSVLARGEDRFDLPAFFSASKGRYRTFFALQPSIFSAATMLGSQATIPHTGLGLIEELREGSVFVAVSGYEGYRPRKVVSVVEQDGNTVLELNGSVAGPDAPRGVRRLIPARFGADRMNIDWRTDTVAEITVSLQRIRRFATSLEPLTTEVGEEITNESNVTINAENMEIIG